MLERDVTKTRVRTSRHKIHVSKRAPYRKSLDFVASCLQGNSFCFSIVLEYNKSNIESGKVTPVLEAEFKSRGIPVPVKTFFFKSVRDSRTYTTLQEK